MKYKCTTDQWNRLVKEGLVIDGETNTRYPFEKMCKRFGSAYLSYLEASYSARDVMTDEEFCRLNGEVPLSFLARLQ